jgi:hypothetical protein
MKATADKDLMILHHTSGKHLETKTFSVAGSKHTFSVTLAGLFVPMQLYHDEQRFEKDLSTVKKKYITPYGGDAFILRKEKNLLNFFVMDVMGHGFETHHITTFLLRFILKNRHSPHLMSLLDTKLKNLTDKDKKTLDNELSLAIEQARKKGYSVHREQQYRDYLTFFASNVPLVSAGSASVDLDNEKIYFSNMGGPTMYCVIMDEKNKILGIKTFSQMNRPLGILENHTILTNSISLPKNTNRFRVIIFSDAIIEQTITHTTESLSALVALLPSGELQKHYKSVAKKKSMRLQDEEKLLHSILTHHIFEKPEQLTRFFYQALLKHNSQVQADDMTLIVADFQKV